jgi:ParB-like chromosome segregation protein Spo0J
MTAKAKTPKAPAPAAPMIIRRVRLDDLRPDPKNPRTHPARNLSVLSGSFSTWGQVEPLIVQAGTMRIIAGHGRVEALRALGTEECDVRELDVTDAQARRLALTLNRSSDLAGYDDAALVEALQAIKAEDGPELLELTGFGEEELAAMMAPIDVPEATDQKEPEIKAEHLIEVYCSAADLEQFRPVLEGWEARGGVTIHIS